MQFSQLAGEGVNVLVREFPGRRRREEAQTFPGFQFETRYLVSYFQWQTTYDVQHIQRPAALRDGNFLERFEPAELLAHFRFGNHRAILHQRNARLGGKPDLTTKQQRNEVIFLLWWLRCLVVQMQVISLTAAVGRVRAWCGRSGPGSSRRPGPRSQCCR